MARDEPFTRLVKRVVQLRDEVSDDLCFGRWDNEADGRALVGKYRAYVAIIEEMRTLSGPGTEFGERDL